MKISANLTRTGILTYRRPDGQVVRELRLPDEVFHEDSIKSMAGTPVTDLHPPTLVDSKNARKHTVGFVSERVRQDGPFVQAEITIQDQEVIDKINGR